MPPGVDERQLGPQHSGQLIFTERNNRRYLETVRKYASVIQGQFFGHLHSDTFRLIYDEQGELDFNPILQGISSFLCLQELPSRG